MKIKMIDEHYGTILSIDPILTISLIFITIILFFIMLDSKLKSKSMLPVIWKGGLSIIIWETGIEFIGWRFGFWDFMLLEEDWVVVLTSALMTGLFFYLVSLPLSAIIVYLIDRGMKKLEIAVFIFLVVGGFLIDVIGGFTTYVVTLLVWTCGMLIYFGTLHYLSNRFLNLKFINGKCPEGYTAIYSEKLKKNVCKPVKLKK